MTCESPRPVTGRSNSTIVRYLRRWAADNAGRTHLRHPSGRVAPRSENHVRQTARAKEPAEKGRQSTGRSHSNCHGDCGASSGHRRNRRSWPHHERGSPTRRPLEDAHARPYARAYGASAHRAERQRQATASWRRTDRKWRSATPTIFALARSTCSSRNRSVKPRHIALVVHAANGKTTRHRKQCGFVRRGS